MPTFRLTVKLKAIMLLTDWLQSHNAVIIQCVNNKKLSCCCDSRSYCVRRTGKLSNRLRLQIYKRLVRTIRFNG